MIKKLFNDKKFSEFWLRIRLVIELDFKKINTNAIIYMYDYQGKVPYTKEILKYLRRFLTFRCNYKDLKARFSLYINYINFLN